MGKAILFISLLMCMLLAMPLFAAAQGDITSISDELALTQTKVSALRAEVQSMADSITLLTILVMIALVAVLALALFIGYFYLKSRSEEAEAIRETPKEKKKQAKGSMVHYPIGGRMQQNQESIHQKVQVKPVMQHPAEYLEREAERVHRQHQQMQRKSILRSLRREAPPHPIEALKRDTRQKAIYDLKKQLRE